MSTATDRLIEAGVEVRFEHRPFFDVPDSFVIPRDPERVPLNVTPRVRTRLINVLVHDPRFRGMGYSEFITRALDMLDCANG